MRNRPKLRIGLKWHFLATARGATLAATFIIVALSAQLLCAQSAATQSPGSAGDRPTFDVASIKANKSGDGRMMMRPQPGGRFTGTNVTLRMLINNAYLLRDPQTVGGPDWINSERFDIEAKADGNPSFGQMRLMIQSLLADRFKLIAHHETRQLPVYALVLLKTGKTGPHLVLHSDDAKCVDISAGPPPPPANGATPPPTPCGGFLAGSGHMAAQRVTMDTLSRVLGQFVDRMVVDHTGLTGAYDLDFEFTPVQTPPGFQPGSVPDTGDPSAPPLIFTAVQEQLGLKLESQTAPVDVLVIDHVEQPSEN
jgi:uncharacterized protein (TIGR03435 family)